jgi:hypothetical protein
LRNDYEVTNWMFDPVSCWMDSHRAAALPSAKTLARRATKAWRPAVGRSTQSNWIFTFEHAGVLHMQQCCQFRLISLPENPVSLQWKAPRPETIENQNPTVLS